MLPHERLQTNRFEHKYLITDHQALAVRDFVQGVLEPDPYMRPEQPDGYLVYSIYMDSPDYTLCKATITGNKNRFKLRVRYYDANPAKPVFFEVKRRVNDAILKSRAMVKRDAAMELLDGKAANIGQLSNPGKAKDMSDLTNFCQLRDDLSARATTNVAYRREAYQSLGDNSARLTLDRELRGCDATGDFSDIGGEHWRATDLEGVILELKFTHRYPQWMTELVRRFNIQRQSVPKYVECVSALRAPRNVSTSSFGQAAAFAD